MQDIFKTFKPKNSIIKTFVDYYYLDIKPNNSVHEFDCFPHFNNTISLYQSHQCMPFQEILFDETVSPLQIFTPVREEVMRVRQLGKVYRIVVVFHPLGIQQFYRNIGFTELIYDYDFFMPEELSDIFSTTQIGRLTEYLDNFLFKRFEPFSNIYLEQVIQAIFENCIDFSVKKCAEHIGVSRQYLNRLFQSHLGVSIKKFHEIVRFRQSINQKLFENPNESFTKLAYECNFNDQSHFVKTYKSLTSNSPKVFFSKGTILGEEDIFWHLDSKD